MNERSSGGAIITITRHSTGQRGTGATSNRRVKRMRHISIRGKRWEEEEELTIENKGVPRILSPTESKWWETIHSCVWWWQKALICYSISLRLAYYSNEMRFSARFLSLCIPGVFNAIITGRWCLQCGTLAIQLPRKYSCDAFRRDAMIQTPTLPRLSSCHWKHWMEGKPINHNGKVIILFALPLRPMEGSPSIAWQLNQMAI